MSKAAAPSAAVELEYWTQCPGTNIVIGRAGEKPKHPFGGLLNVSATASSGRSRPFSIADAGTNGWGRCRGPQVEPTRHSSCWQTQTLESRLVSGLHRCPFPRAGMARQWRMANTRMRLNPGRSSEANMLTPVRRFVLEGLRVLSSLTLPAVSSSPRCLLGTVHLLKVQ